MGRADEWLVLRAQSGDRGALTELLMHTQRRLRPYAVAMLGDEDDASDLVQEVLITIYRKLHMLQDSRAYDAWTRRIASRATMAMIQRKRHQETTHALIETQSDEPAVELDEVDPADVAVLRPLLKQISPASREVLTLHYLDEELSLEDIATVLNLPLGTVKSRLSYGLKRLRELALQWA